MALPAHHFRLDEHADHEKEHEGNESLLIGKAKALNDEEGAGERGQKDECPSKHEGEQDGPCHAAQDEEQPGERPFSAPQSMHQRGHKISSREKPGQGNAKLLHEHCQHGTSSARGNSDDKPALLSEVRQIMRNKEISDNEADDPHEEPEQPAAKDKQQETTEDPEPCFHESLFRKIFENAIDAMESVTRFCVIVNIEVVIL